jgi:hypothetical protein
MRASQIAVEDLRSVEEGRGELWRTLIHNEIIVFHVCSFVHPLAILNGECYLGSQIKSLYFGVPS